MILFSLLILNYIAKLCLLDLWHEKNLHEQHMWGYVSGTKVKPIKKI